MESGGRGGDVSSEVHIFTTSSNLHKQTVCKSSVFDGVYCSLHQQFHWEENQTVVVSPARSFAFRLSCLTLWRPVAATCAFAQMNLSVDGSTVNNANNLHMLSIVICFTATPVFKDSYYSCSPSPGLYYSSQVWWSSSRDKTGLCYSRHEK